MACVSYWFTLHPSVQYAAFTCIPLFFQLVKYHRDGSHAGGLGAKYAPAKGYGFAAFIYQTLYLANFKATLRAYYNSYIFSLHIRPQDLLQAGLTLVLIGYEYKVVGGHIGGLKCSKLAYMGYYAAAGLLCRLAGYPLIARLLRLVLSRLHPDHASLRGHRYYPVYAKLDALLYNELHLARFGNALIKRYALLRLGRTRFFIQKLKLYSLPGDSLYLRKVFIPTAVGQHHPVAALHAQHLGYVLHILAGDGGAVLRHVIRLYKKPVQNLTIYFLSALCLPSDYK